MHCAVDGLADGADRQAGRRPTTHDHVDRRRPDAAARSGRAQGRRRDPARTPDDRDPPRERRIPAACIGIAVDHNGATLNIRARKAVIVATGGSTGNVNFRRMFDPRLTEEYCGLAGMPWSDQDASGETCRAWPSARRCGALFNQTGEFGYGITKPGAIGCQYGYRNLRWMPGSEVFDKARATGLAGHGLAGRRSWSTCWASASTTRPARQFTCQQLQDRSIPTMPGSYLNAKNIKYNPNNFLNAALAGIGDGHNGGGPIWAIFDADAVAREKWNPEPAARRHRRRLLLQRRHDRGTGAEDRDEIPARADAAAKSRRDGRALQFIRRCRQGRGFRQAHAALQDRQAAVLCRLGDAGASTTPAPACASTRAAR